MSVPRRTYLFIFCFFSLQAVTWGVINLLRSLTGSTDPTSLAFWIAVIVVALPAYLAHWRIVARAASKRPEETAAGLRRFYLAAMLASLLAPALANAVGLAEGVVRVAMGLRLYENSWTDGTRSLPELALHNLAAIIGLGILWGYHVAIVRRDDTRAGAAQTQRTIDRLYLLAFAATGSVMTVLGTVHIVRWLMHQVGTSATRLSIRETLPDDVALVVIGTPVWLAFWAAAHRRHRSADPDERRSLLRKVYLYGWLFAAAFGTVANLTGVGAGLFKRILGLEVPGDLRGPLPVILVLPFLWLYHQRVLQRDSASDGSALGSGAVRRLYLHLVAGIGFAATAVGTAGVLRVLIRATLDVGFGSDLKSQLAWSAAAAIAGAPAWLIPWRMLERQALLTGDAGLAERRSTIRRLYLYLFLSLAGLTVLSSAVYVVYRLVGTLVGATPSGDLASRLAEALAFTAIGAGAWLLHFRVLRADERLEESDRATRLAAINAVVVESADNDFSARVVEGVRAAFPDLRLQSVALTGRPIADVASAAATSADPLNQADLVIAQAGTLLDSRGTSPSAGAGLADGARLLLVPARGRSVLWAGVGSAEVDWQIEQIIHAVGRLADGLEVEAKHGPGVGQALGIALLAILFLIVATAIVGLVLGQTVSSFD